MHYKYTSYPLTSSIICLESWCVSNYFCLLLSVLLGSGWGLPLSIPCNPRYSYILFSSCPITFPKWFLLVFLRRFQLSHRMCFYYCENLFYLQCVHNFFIPYLVHHWYQSTFINFHFLFLLTFLLKYVLYNARYISIVLLILLLISFSLVPFPSIIIPNILCRSLFIMFYILILFIYIYICCVDYSSSLFCYLQIRSSHLHRE